jgi:hypothetical protein
VLSIALLGAVVATRMHASALASLAGLGRAQRYAAATAIARSGAQPVHVRLAGVSPARATRSVARPTCPVFSSSI